MKHIVLGFLLCSSSVVFAAEDDAKLKAELDLVRLLLRNLQQKEPQEKVGTPLEPDANEAPAQRSTYSGEGFLEEVELDLQDDEELTDEERDVLARSLDSLTLRAGSCRATQYTCPNQNPVVCVSMGDMCSGTAQCDDGSDEDQQTCADFFGAVCPASGRFYCVNRQSRHLCLGRDRMCDGRNNCADGSDENSNTCATMPSCDDGFYVIRRTDEARYESCTGSDQCVTADRWCDGNQHCQNNADESDCADDLLIREAVDIHNALRNIHENTPPVTWNQEVADRAQAWATYLDENDLFQHSPGNSEYRQNSGENIFWSSSTGAHLTNAIIAFYREERNYDYNTGSSSNGGVIGHFTQVVWDNSITIGCGVSRIHATLIVCQYSPPGNYIGAYTSHVHRPKPGLNPLEIADSLQV